MCTAPHSCFNVRRDCQMLACTIVGSSLDYCNALFTGMSETKFNKLQRVQNTFAFAVTGTNMCDHITPVLVKLQWLPIRVRVTFKIDRLVYKLHDSHQPSYLNVKLKVTCHSKLSVLLTCCSCRNRLLHQCQPLEDGHSALAPSRHGTIYPLRLGNRPILEPSETV